MSAFPEFGLAGRISVKKLTRTCDWVEYQDGLLTRQQPLKRGLVLEASRADDTTGWGIASATNGTANTIGVPIVSATLSITERTSEPALVPTTDYNVEGGKAIEEGDVLAGVAGLLFIQQTQTLTINGKGTLPTALDKDLTGSRFATVTLQSATRAASSITLASAFIEAAEQTNSNSDLATWSVTLKKNIKNADATGATRFITVSTATTAASTSVSFVFSSSDLTSSFYTVAKTIELSADGYTNVSETLTMYDEADTTVITTTDETPTV